MGASTNNARSTLWNILFFGIVGIGLIVVTVLDGIDSYFDWISLVLGIVVVLIGFNRISKKQSSNK